MAEEQVRTQQEGGVSSVVIKCNGKGEESYEAKVYEGSTQEDMDEIARTAAATMAGLRSGEYRGQ